MNFTPKDSVDALRLMSKLGDQLFEPDDPPEVKEAVQGSIAMYLAGKRKGEIGADVEFLDWYETEVEVDDEADPTE